MIAVLNPLAVIHVLALTVIFNKFLTVDFNGAVILIEKTTLFKQVTLHYGRLYLVKIY